MWRLGLAAVLAALALDQLSKWVILTRVMNPPEPIAVLPVFDLVLAWNRGVSFSMFWSDGAYAPYLLAGFALLVVAGLAVWLARVKAPLPALGLGLIIGGAVGNVIDRLRFGAVVDFLYFHYAGWGFPAFNLADTAITVGVALLLLDGLFGKLRPVK
ncbi:MAG: signal peptidase II [Pseudomonadota bacterium]